MYRAIHNLHTVFSNPRWQLCSEFMGEFFFFHFLTLSFVSACHWDIFFIQHDRFPNSWNLEYFFKFFNFNYTFIILICHHLDYNYCSMIWIHLKLVNFNVKNGNIKLKCIHVLYALIKISLSGHVLSSNFCHRFIWKQKNVTWSMEISQIFSFK